MNKKLWKVADWEQLCWTEGERCTHAVKRVFMPSLPSKSSSMRAKIVKRSVRMDGWFQLSFSENSSKGKISQLSLQNMFILVGVLSRSVQLESLSSFRGWEFLILNDTTACQRKAAAAWKTEDSIPKDFIYSVLNLEVCWGIPGL